MHPRSHPDTGDTAALDRKLEALLDAYEYKLREGLGYSNVVDVRHEIHEHVAAVVQAEREACAMIAEDRALVDWHPAMLRIAQYIRARSAPRDNTQ